MSDAEWVECPPDERVRFADGIGAISGMTTLDLDRFKWDGKKEIPNPTWDFPEPPTSDSVLMWAYEKLEKRWPNLKDRFLIRKMRWRVSPSGKGVHVGLHVVVRRTPKARTYSELDPINVFEVRRALGDDPKRWEYDLRRARGDPGSVHGWLADGNRRGTGGGNYEWQTAGPWQKVV